MKCCKLLALVCSLGFCAILFSPSIFATPQSLVIALGSEPERGFDPVLGWGKYNNPLFQSTLIKRNAELELVPDLATSWHLSKDKLSWTVSIKPNLRFSDGSQLDATDIKFTFDTAAKSASEQDLTMLEYVEIKDSHTLIFHLKHPDINFIDVLATLGIVPSDSYNADYGNHPIGSGPYQLERWDKGQQVIASINPYYVANATGNQPYFKKLIIVFGGEDSRFIQLQTGRLDLAAIPPRYAKHIPEHYRLWRIDSVDNRGIVWPMTKERQRPKYPSERIGNAVSHDAAIRQAVTLAVDRKLLVNQLLDGFARSAQSIADGLPWGFPFKQTDLTTEQRQDQAKALLQKAGWQLKLGIVYKQVGDKSIPAKMKLYYSAGDSVREQLAITVAAMVKPLGIILQPTAASWDVIASKMFTQPVLMGYGSHSPSEVYFTHHSKYAGQEFYNSGYYQNPQVDNLLDKARQASSWQASLPYWQQAQKIINADQPWTWLVNLEHLYAANDCLDLGRPGIEPHGHGWPIINNILDWRWKCQ